MTDTARQFAAASRAAGAADALRPAAPTSAVKIVNANWTAGLDGDHGPFEIMIITEDDHRHVAAPSPEPMTANIIGKMPWTEPVQPSVPAH